MMDVDKTVTATFAINTYSLGVTTLGQGSVAKNPDQPSYDHGTTVTLTATPATGWHFAGWSEAVTGMTNPTSVTMDGGKTVTATFAINTYTIAASAGDEGRISANGAVAVDHGTNQTFTITPGTGYHIATVLVDGSPVEPQASYTFTNVTDNHTIEASFAINTYSLTVNTVGQGSVTKNPDQASYDHGSAVELTATPATGWHFAGWSGAATGSTNPVSVTMDGDKTVTATFAINTYTISASAAANGTITPSGAVSVNHGDSQSFAIAADANHHILDVKADGISQGAVASYSFTNVTDNHTIEASFAIDTHSLTVNTVGQGSVAKNPDQASYDHGSTVQLTATPATGWHFAGWSGAATGTTNPLSVTMDGDKTVTATFAINTYTITASAGANGTITPSGAVSVNHGGSRSFAIVADANHHILDVKADGVSQGAVASYSFTNVTDNHTIEASFAIDTHSLTVNTVGQGSVAKSPDQASYDHGSTVELTATPATG